MIKNLNILVIEEKSVSTSNKIISSIHSKIPVLRLLQHSLLPKHSSYMRLRGRKKSIVSILLKRCPDVKIHQPVFFLFGKTANMVIIIVENRKEKIVKALIRND